MIYLFFPLYDPFGFGESDSDSRFSSPLNSSPERLRLCASLRARWRSCCSGVWLSSWPRDLAPRTSSHCTPFSPRSATQSPVSPHPDFASSGSWSRWQRGRRQGRGDVRELPSFSLSREKRTEPTPLGLPQTSTTSAQMFPLHPQLPRNLPWRWGSTHGRANALRLAQHSAGTGWHGHNAGAAHLRSDCSLLTRVAWAPNELASSGTVSFQAKGDDEGDRDPAWPYQLGTNHIHCGS